MLVKNGKKRYLLYRDGLPTDQCRNGRRILASFCCKRQPVEGESSKMEGMAMTGER